MKHIKRINELNTYDLDFDIFQEIMYEIVDEHNHTFNKLDVVKDGIVSETYQCSIEDLFEGFKYGSIELKIGLYGNSFSNKSFNDLLEIIDHDLRELKYSELIESNLNKLKVIVRDIEENIYPRLQQYDNFVDYSIRYEGITAEDNVLFEVIVKNKNVK